jgi:hypothetical protein
MSLNKQQINSCRRILPVTDSMKAYSVCWEFSGIVTQRIKFVAMGLGYLSPWSQMTFTWFLSLKVLRLTKPLIMSNHWFMYHRGESRQVRGPFDWKTCYPVWGFSQVLSVRPAKAVDNIIIHCNCLLLHIGLPRHISLVYQVSFNLAQPQKFVQHSNTTE